MSISKTRLAKGGVVVASLAVGVWLVASTPIVQPASLPAGMDPAAPQRCLAVFVLCIALWFTNAIPLAATGLLAIVLLPLLGITSATEAFAKFGNSAVFFMLGVFLLAAAMIATGLSKRVTLLALQRFDRSPSMLVGGVACSSAFLSLWMPEHAVAAMIYPILLEVSDTLGLRQGHNYGKKLFLALAWGAIIGGVGTFLGGARAPLALSLLREHRPDLTISFLGWMFAALPVVVILVAVAILMLRWRIPDDIESIRPATMMLDERVARLGPMSGRERRLAGLGVVTIAAWVTVGHDVGLEVIAVLSAVLLFVLRIAPWGQLQSYVNWGVLIMYGGAIALGQALADTHAMDFLARRLIGSSFPPWALLAIMATLAIALTECISNSAAVAVLLPIGYSLGETAGVDPLTITLAVTIASGLAFLLPISSPPNAISFAAGHYSVREVVQIGWPLAVVALGVLLATMTFWWPVLGFGGEAGGP